MKLLVMPKCPYCHTEYKLDSLFNNKLADLYGEYCLKTVEVTCQKCGNTYYVSKQTRFIGRKNK